MAYADSVPTADFARQVDDAINRQDLSSLTVLVETVRNSKNAKERFESAALVIISKINPDFDPSKVPEMNVQTPAGSWQSAGSDPASISDPVKRAQYETAVANARSYAAQYRVQTALCKHSIYLIQQAAISRSPNQNKEFNSAQLLYAIDSFISRNGRQVSEAEKIKKAFVKWIRIQQPNGG